MEERERPVSVGVVWEGGGRAGGAEGQHVGGEAEVSERGKEAGTSEESKNVGLVGGLGDAAMRGRRADGVEGDGLDVRGGLEDLRGGEFVRSESGGERSNVERVRESGMVVEMSRGESLGKKKSIVRGALQR